MDIERVDWDTVRFLNASHFRAKMQKPEIIRISVKGFDGVLCVTANTKTKLPRRLFGPCRPRQDLA